jgi:hypothetical protein
MGLAEIPMRMAYVMTETKAEYLVTLLALEVLQQAVTTTAQTRRTLTKSMVTGME